MKRIIYLRADGGVSVMIPVINTHPVKENITEDQALERARKDVPKDATNVYVVDESDIPEDHSLWDKWTIKSGKIVVGD